MESISNTSAISLLVKCFWYKEWDGASSLLDNIDILGFSSANLATSLAKELIFVKRLTASTTISCIQLGTHFNPSLPFFAGIHRIPNCLFPKLSSSHSKQLTDKDINSEQRDGAIISRAITAV